MSMIEKVLIVDDEDHIRRIAELSVKNVGKWQPVTASSGPEALELAAAEQPQVVLLDVMMPGMDGPTTHAHLQQESATAHIPVIFLTAKVQSHEVERYLGLGAAGVIAKPFDPITLPDEIRKILEQASPRP